ncbi:MAG: hypothetical protein GY934_15680, partial [Gammaproteobacteria bacterium]|nr:hypothetical protein [Gammaproteobacteria bacterium]
KKVQIKDKDTKPVAGSGSGTPLAKPAKSVSEPPSVKPATAGLIRGRSAIKVQLMRVGDSLKIIFPFTRSVPAAVFERADTVWAVFESDQVLDLNEIRKKSAGVIGKIEKASNQNLQIVRMYLNGRQLVRASRDSQNWIITIGNLVLDKTRPLLLKRTLREDGGSKFQIMLPGAGKVHLIGDKEIGGKLAVVTAKGPTRGVIKTQKFVEFTALKTIHGVVVQPLSDHLRVRLAHDDVIINQRGGLTVSGGTVHQYANG